MSDTQIAPVGRAAPYVPPLRRKFEENPTVCVVAGALIALLLFALIGLDGFWSAQNLGTLLRNSAFLGFVALGMTFVVVSGRIIDLSVVPQIALAAIVVTALSSHGLAIAAPAAVLACLVFAVVNGLGAGLMRGNGVIVTLATATAGMGVLNYITGGAQYTGNTSLLSWIGNASVLGVPAVFLIFVAAAVLAHNLLTTTSFGYSLRATGTNREAARIAGLNTSRTLTLAFAVSSLGAAAAGMALAGYSSSAVSTMAAGYDFNALAAVVIGGTSLFGGRGSILGTVLGVAFVQVLLSVLSLAGLPFQWQQFVQGFIIVATLAADAVLRRRGGLK
ncbi:ABC transporter permease [Gordonia paraffinivorans]|uniref:ABC transporter permease n=1 Tax=Gordonia paraffinivorans TaxID=175628 RepID=UPI001445DB11|nr:ABC transporter permease [Gordonia paraffinivorans]